MEFNAIFYASEGITDRKLQALADIRDSFDDVPVEEADWVRPGQCVMAGIRVTEAGLAFNVDAYLDTGDEEE